MNAHASVGMLIGLMVGLLICVVLFKFANKDKNIKTQYDERQEAIRGKGYKYSFYTVIFLEVSLMCFTMSDIALPFENYLLHVFVMLAGCLVLCVYSIWNGVYWGLNNNRKRYTAIIAIGVILNVIPVAAVIARGGFQTKGFDSLPVINLMVLIWMAIIGIAALVKKVADTRAEKED